MATRTTSPSARWPWTSAKKAEPEPQEKSNNDYLEVAGRRFQIEYVLERRRTAVAHFGSETITIKLPRWLGRRERNEVIDSLKRRSFKHLEKLGQKGFRELDDKNGALTFRHGDQFNLLGKLMVVIVHEDPEAIRSRAKLIAESVHVTIPPRWRSGRSRLWSRI